MTIQNLELGAIERMTTKDALRFTDSILRKFDKSYKVYANNFISYVKKDAPLNMVIELTIQVWDTKETQRRFKVVFMRGVNWSCSNGMQYDELNERDFTSELNFQKRFNEIN